MDAPARLREREDLPVERLSPAPAARSVARAVFNEIALVTAPIAEAPPRASARLALKRAFDVLGATAALAILSPLMGLIWILVVVTSPGPALHRSPRAGRFGRVFMMPKFRTMHLGNPSCAREDLGNAERSLTPIGKLLRRTGLDELPQLVSVLRGEMSLIGPRPLLLNDPASFERAKFPRALDVRPGISGLAQVSGRNLVSPRRKARLDAFYARALSLRLDFLLLVRTLWVIVSGKGFL